MSGLVNALLIAAVAAVVIVRQFRAGRVDTDRRWWVLPGILAVLALREPDLLDADHHTASVAIVASELLVGLAVGAGWAWTTRIWTEADGAVWSKGTKASVVIWAVGIGTRAGLFAYGVMGSPPGQLGPFARSRRHPARPLRHPDVARAVPASDPCPSPRVR
jgi:hypothetical protein